MGNLAETFLAIVNPAAGGGRGGQRATKVLAQLRDAGIAVEERRTQAPRDGMRLVREAYDQGYRRFIAAGGDGTCWEVLNGLGPRGFSSDPAERASMAVLPLGTGNSFLLEFTDDGSAHTLGAIKEGRHQPCDVVRLTHRDGIIYFINLLGYGFAADTTINTQRRSYKRFGNVGYVLGVLHSVVQLRRRILPMRVDGGALEDAPITLLCICNTRYTAGKMMMAPDASVNDGRADLIRVEAIGRLSVVRTFPKIYAGTHIQHPAVSARAVQSIDFDVDREVDMMIDGEVFSLQPQSIDVLPGALEIWA